MCGQFVIVQTKLFKKFSKQFLGHPNIHHPTCCFLYFQKINSKLKSQFKCFIKKNKTYYISINIKKNLKSFKLRKKVIRF